MHPASQCWAVRGDWYWPVIEAVNTKIKLGEVDETPRLQYQCYLVYETFVITDLEAASASARTMREIRQASTYTRGHKTGMGDVEFAIEVL